MLTIEQLFALYEIMDTEGSGLGGKPRKKGNAYADLKNLIDIYIDEPPRHPMLRFASDALYTLVEQMEQAKAQGLNKDQFQKAVKTQMQRFNRAYTNIPDDVLEEEGSELKKTLDEMDSSLKMARSNRETVKKEEEKIAQEVTVDEDDLPPLNINQEISQAADPVQKETKENAEPSMEDKYNAKMQTMRDDVLKLVDDINELVKDPATFKTTKGMTAYRAKADSFVNQMAKMVALDEVKRYSGIKAALDDDMVENTADLISAGGPEFTRLFDRIDRRFKTGNGLSMATLAEDLNFTGYESVAGVFEQPKKSYNKNSVRGVLTKTVENLQKSVANAKGRTLSEDDKKKVAGSLLDVIALKELAQKDSRRTLSVDDIKKQKEEILNRDNKQFSAYRAVLKKMEKSQTATVRIVEGLDDKISLRAFKEKLVKDAGIQLKEKVDTKTLEKGADSPEKKQG